MAQMFKTSCCCLFILLSIYSHNGLPMAAAAASTAECEELGFPNALCSDCESMAEYVKDEELIADCKKCCVKDQQDNTKYTSAVLKVCPYKLSGLPHIQDFVGKHAKSYSNLKVVKYVGAYPKLTLTKDDKQMSVRVDNWKVATFHEFLSNKLENPKTS